MEQATTEERNMEATTDTRKVRVRLINDGRVTDTVFMEAESFSDAEEQAPDAERYLVEPMPSCEGCGREMGQTDPRTARYPDGTPVYDDPWNAYKGIKCVSCGFAHLRR
jgi:hypothetical protein